MKDYFDKEFDCLSMMNALVKKLAVANVPFEVRGFPSASKSKVGTLQICAPSIEEPVIDVVCHGESYGHEYGLMEAMASNGYARKLGWADNFRGYLDADEAFELIADVLGIHQSEAAE